MKILHHFWNTDKTTKHLKRLEKNDDDISTVLYQTVRRIFLQMKVIYI